MRKEHLMNIAGRPIGGNNPAFVVAEISANHKQNFKTAAALIKKAKASGADAVKFQTFTPDTMTLDSRKRYFRVDHPKWGGQTLHQLYHRTSVPWDWFKELKKISDDLGIIFFSTAFDQSSVDLLEEIGAAAYKVASQELVDLPLIEYIAKTKKPIIFSTGMATRLEIQEAVKTAKKSGAKEMALLKCVSTYPAQPGEMNLKTISDMQKRFSCVIGLSDHTLNMMTPVTAVALGAKIIERHLTASRKAETVDSFFSTEPQEFKEMVRHIRLVEECLGKVHYGPTQTEKKSKTYRRSLFAVENIKKGEVFTRQNVRSIRPSHGLSPKHLNQICGKRASRNIQRGEPLMWRFIEGKRTL